MIAFLRSTRDVWLLNYLIRAQEQRLPAICFKTGRVRGVSNHRDGRDATYFVVACERIDNMISSGTPCMISGRDAVFPLTLCWAYRGFVERGISMQCILIPSIKGSAAIPEAALIPLTPQGAELRMGRAA